MAWILPDGAGSVEDAEGGVTVPAEPVGREGVHPAYPDAGGGLAWTFLC